MSNRLRKYIPNMFKESIYDVDFLSLYKKGYRFIFIDIDNTLVSYTESIPNNEVLELITNLKNIGFEVILISNNYYKRVSTFAKNITDMLFVHYALKPLKRGYKKGLKMASKDYKPTEVISIGDQLMTDVKGSNKMNFYSILVQPIEKKTDVFTTRVNRFFERRKLRKIKKKYPKEYEERLKKYEEM